jgi:hypothetical protein
MWNLVVMAICIASVLWTVISFALYVEDYFSKRAAAKNDEPQKKR